MVASSSLLERPDSPVAIMTRLYAAGFPLIPLGRVKNQDGKEPLVAGFNNRKRLPLQVVIKRMAENDSAMYGIRLDGRIVIDLDTDNDETRAYFANRFEPSPLTTRTSRGVHHHYSWAGDGKPRDVRLPAVRIDFKAGTEFVVGPGSIRPDNGFRYEVATGDFVTTKPPLFIDRGPSIITPADAPLLIPHGSRHSTLIARAREYVPCVDSFDELVADLRALRDLRFEDAVDPMRGVSDAEIAKAAEWAWKIRLEGNLYEGRNSAVKVNRLALDWLYARNDSGRALQLYILLLSEHGHHPGKVFAIVADGLIKAGRLNMGRRQIYEAKDGLLEERLLDLVHRARGKEDKNQYRLISPVVALTLRGEGAGGRGSLITFISPQDTQGIGA